MPLASVGVDLGTRWFDYEREILNSLVDILVPVQ